jgi:hypothetical protein
MDGYVLQAAFADGALESVPASSTSLGVSSVKGKFTYTDEDTAKVSQRLEDLGYL